MLSKIYFYIIIFQFLIPLTRINSQIIYCQKESEINKKSGVHLNYEKLSNLFLEEAPKQIDTDTIMINGHVYYKKGLGLKHPEAAFFMAIFPGILFHGLGHLYSGKPKDALVIFGISAGSVLGMIVSFAPSYDGGRGSGTEYIYASFIVLFLATWAYDIIVSPIICIKENRRIMNDLTFYPYMEKDRFGNQLGVKLNYHF